MFMIQVAANANANADIQHWAFGLAPLVPWCSHLQCCLPFPAGMYGLPRPWYFPLQRSYWSGSGRVETWDWPWSWSWCGGSTTRLSVMEEDQACALDQRRTGMKEPRCW